MPLAKPLRQVVLLLVSVAALGAGAFLLARSRGEQSAHRKHEPLEPLPEAGKPAAITSALTEIRQKSLKLAAPAWSGQRLAVGRDRLVRLTAEECISLSLPGFAEKRFPLAGPRAVVELPGGALVVVAERETLRLDPTASEPVRLPRASFLPGSELVPERRDPSKLWILHRPTHTVVRYELVTAERPLLPTDRMLELPEGATGAFAALRDGSWLYSTGRGAELEARLPEGKPRRLEVSGAPPWRLLPGPRIDEFWAVSDSGEVTRQLLAGGPRKGSSFRSKDPPLDVAATPKRLGMILVHEGGPRREFRLVVWNSSGAIELERVLGTDKALPEDEWAPRVLARELALSDEPPLVAVLEPSGLRVWDIPTGELVHSAP